MSEPWTMTYSGPQVLLPTDVGTVEVTWTDATHCHVSAYSDGRRAGDVLFRGRHWYVSIHLYAAHQWGEGRQRHGDYRHQFTDENSKTIAPTYRAKIVAAISAAVSAFAEEHPRMLAEAEVNHWDHETERADEAVAKAERELADLKSTAYQQQQRLRAAHALLAEMTEES